MAKEKNYRSEQARLNEKKHQFGQPDANRRGNPTAASRMRAFYDWCENKATLDELKAYARDENNPATRRRFVRALMKCERVQDFFDLTNQTHGQPKQVVEFQELPSIDMSVFGVKQKEDEEKE